MILTELLNNGADDVQIVDFIQSEPDAYVRGNLYREAHKMLGRTGQNSLDTVSVHKHIRAKYACRHCQNHETKTPILTAPMPATAFPNSLAAPSAVAHILCQKFVEGSPLYRQQAALHRLGFDLSRQTMANWMLAGAGWLDKLFARMTLHLKKRDIAHADETTLQPFSSSAEITVAGL